MLINNFYCPAFQGGDKKATQTWALAQIIFELKLFTINASWAKALEHHYHYPQAKACGNLNQIQNLNKNL